MQKASFDFEQHFKCCLSISLFLDASDSLLRRHSSIYHAQVQDTVTIFAIAHFKVPTMRSTSSFPLVLYTVMIFHDIDDSLAKLRGVLLSNWLSLTLTIRTGLLHCANICPFTNVITPILLNICGLIADATGQLDRFYAANICSDHLNQFQKTGQRSQSTTYGATHWLKASHGGDSVRRDWSSDANHKSSRSMPHRLSTSATRTILKQFGMWSWDINCRSRLYRILPYMA